MGNKREIKSLSQQRHCSPTCPRGNGRFSEIGLYLDTKQAEKDPVSSLWSTGSSSPDGNARLCWWHPKTEGSADFPEGLWKGSGFALKPGLGRTSGGAFKAIPPSLLALEGVVLQQWWLHRLHSDQRAFRDKFLEKQELWTPSTHHSNNSYPTPSAGRFSAVGDLMIAYACSITSLRWIRPGAKAFMV